MFTLFCFVFVVSLFRFSVSFFFPSFALFCYNFFCVPCNLFNWYILFVCVTMYVSIANLYVPLYVYTNNMFKHTRIIKRLWI